MCKNLPLEFVDVEMKFKFLLKQLQEHVGINDGRGSEFRVLPVLHSVNVCYRRAK